MAEKGLVVKKEQWFEKRFYRLGYGLGVDCQ
jgi:hypothetical protein